MSSSGGRVGRLVPGAVKVSDNETYALIQTPPVKEMIDVTKLIGWSFVNNTFFCNARYCLDCILEGSSVLCACMMHRRTYLPMDFSLLIKNLTTSKDTTCQNCLPTHLVSTLLPLNSVFR